MRRSLHFALLLAGLTIVTARPAGAYHLSDVGFRGGIADPENLDGTLMLGGHLEFEEAGSHWHLQPNLLYWSSGHYTDVNPNFDVYYHFAPAASVSPYLGAGLGLHFVSFHFVRDVESDETNTGMNLLGGVLFPGRTARFFIEGRAALTKLDTTSIVGGLTFPLGRR